jgi:four helix bundle protein
MSSFQRSGTGEFIQFLSMAKVSAGEVRAQLYVAMDQNYVDQETFNRLHASTTEIGRMISGLMNYLQNSGVKGTKYKKPVTG